MAHRRGAKHTDQGRPGETMATSPKRENKEHAPRALAEEASGTTRTATQRRRTRCVTTTSRSSPRLTLTDDRSPGGPSVCGGCGGRPRNPYGFRPSRTYSDREQGVRGPVGRPGHPEVQRRQYTRLGRQVVTKYTCGIRPVTSPPSLEQKRALDHGSTTRDP